MTDPTCVPCPNLPHGPVNPFLIFLLDRFHSVPAPVHFLLQALVLKPSLGTYYVVSPENRLGSDFPCLRILGNAFLHHVLD
ncbi:unnamed protein product [Protopolystoma xenopodis]|uniref:Uncharacterized protein n=1 Tax=Protopolystoma xenopodis TaxID=117903 RepID=A0A3S5AGR7_9PLAT|nr:unnamed protein product [Protopolystoma xenopodis]